MREYVGEIILAGAAALAVSPAILGYLHRDGFSGFVTNPSAITVYNTTTINVLVQNAIGVPVTGATLNLESSNAETPGTTNSQGIATYTNVVAGSYTIVVTGPLLTGTFPITVPTATNVFTVTVS